MFAISKWDNYNIDSMKVKIIKVLVDKVQQGIGPACEQMREEEKQ